MRQVTRVVGARHMGKAVIEACIELQDGSPLILVREPHNPHDGNAILLLDIFGRPVGYVQREVARIVAQWMDQGFLVSGKILRAAKFIGISYDDGFFYQNFRYPRAALYREDPPAEDVDEAISIMPGTWIVEREKENV